QDGLHGGANTLSLRSGESLLSRLRVHWDHEPTPNTSQEGNGHDADESLVPSWEGSGMGRFMKGLLSLVRMHGDHEPWTAPASRTHSKRSAKSQARGHCAAAFGVRGACSRFCTQFMGSARERGAFEAVEVVCGQYLQGLPLSKSLSPLLPRGEREKTLRKKGALRLVV